MAPLSLRAVGAPAESVAPASEWEERANAAVRGRWFLRAGLEVASIWSTHIPRVSCAAGGWLGGGALAVTEWKGSQLGRPAPLSQRAFALCSFCWFEDLIKPAYLPCHRMIFLYSTHFLKIISVCLPDLHLTCHLS